MQNKTILFGGSGFLGPVILEKYPELISVGRTPPPNYVQNQHVNIDSLDDLKVLDDLDFENVIFLVGSSNHHFLNQTILEGINLNVIPLKKIMDYLSKRTIKKFICFTTILLYGDETHQREVDEKKIILPYQNEYIFSKYLSEKIVKFYSKNVPSIILRCSNIYGPTKLVRPDIVPTLIQKCLTSSDISVWNTAPQRDFIFLEDAADAVIKLLNSDFTGTLNFGTGISSSIKEICDVLEMCSGKKIKNLNLKVSGPQKFTCDIKLMKSVIDWNPKYSIKQGIIKTYKRMEEWLPECDW
jgi:UDP-glucuronate decarboxylase